MSVCATCYQHGTTQPHDCPGLGEIQITRQLGHGLIVEQAPPRARMALTALANGGWVGARMQDPDLINIADQVLYQVVGYDPEHAALVLELVEDWRPVPTKPLTEAEAEEIRSRWLETYGKPGAAHPVVPLDKEEPGA